MLTMWLLSSRLQIPFNQKVGFTIDLASRMLARTSS